MLYFNFFFFFLNLLFHTNTKPFLEGLLHMDEEHKITSENKQQISRKLLWCGVVDPG